MARVTGRRAAPDEPAPFERLTDREREVFALIGRGLATRDIARQLDLSVKTIETHQARIKEKLGLTNAPRVDPGGRDLDAAMRIAGRPFTERELPEPVARRTGEIPVGAM